MEAEGPADPPPNSGADCAPSMSAAGTTAVPGSATVVQGPRMLESRVHKEGTVGYSSSPDDSDGCDQEVELLVEDLDIPRMPREAAKERDEQQEQQPPYPKISEPIYQMMQQFVSHFKKLHVERECAGGLSVCVVCRTAESTLLEIQEAVRKDPHTRKFILGNPTFMGVLVKLCSTDSPSSPSICGVSGLDIPDFVKRRGYCDGGSIMTLVKGHASDKLWERFLGEAAKKIKTLTFAVGVRPSPAQTNDDSSTPASSDEPVAAPTAIHKGPCVFSFHSSLDVSGCLDARHLWIYNGPKARANVDGSFLAEMHRALQESPRENVPSVGEIAGLQTSKEWLERVLVLEVREEVAVVWCMDQGNFLKVRWSKLVYLLTSFRIEPPAVCLAVLQDVKPIPFLGLLRECVRTLQVLTDHLINEMNFHTFMVATMTSHGAIEVLVGLLYIPDYETRITSIKCLTQMCQRINGRQAVSKAGGAKKVLDRLRKVVSGPPENAFSMPESEKQSLLILLQALFFRNCQQIYELADSDMLGVVYKIQTRSPVGSVTYRLAQYCLRSMLDPGYKEWRHSAQLKLAAMTPEKLGAMTRENLENKSYPPDRSARIEQQTAAALVQSPAPHGGGDSGQASSMPAPPSSIPTGGPLAPPSSGRFYLRGALLPLRCSETMDLWAVNNMKVVSARSLAKVTCSFLNTWKPCTIFFGISPEGHVRGVTLRHQERDSVRRGIDFMVGNLRPHPTPTSVTVEFVPALWSESEPREEKSRYVVEVHVCGAPHTVYTTSDGACFLREGGQTYQARTFEIRAWVVQQEEEYYLRQAIASQEKTVEGNDTTPRLLSAPLPDV